MDGQILSIFMRLIVLSGYAVIILGVLNFLNITYKEKNESLQTNKEYIKEDPINLVLIIIILVFQAIISQIKCDYEIVADPKIIVVVFLAGTPIALGIIFVLSQLVQRIRGVEKKRRWGFRSEKDELTKKEKRIIDFQRKAFHIGMFLLVCIGLYAGDRTLRSKLSRLTPADPLYSYYQTKINEFWGSTNGLDYLNNIFNLTPFSASRGILVLACSVASMVLLTIEITRLSNKHHFPFHKTVQRNLRYSEIDSFASYTHFILGYSFAAVMLPSLLFVAVLSIISFGDAAASIIGMRFGKHHYKHNNKSVEGSIGGFIFTFIPVWIFAGPIYALVAAVGFTIIDIYTPKPIKASDNILTPMVITILFIILSLMNVPAMNLLGI
ncbi:MAG: hypothetical protein ACTSU2_06825 [Promethearchaeota archaeon]